MRLTSYDHDMLRELIACNFDLGQVAFNRYLRHEQILWWTRQPHIAAAIEELKLSQQAQPPAPAQPEPVQPTLAQTAPCSVHAPQAASRSRGHRHYPDPALGSSLMRFLRVSPLLLRLSATCLLATSALAGPPPELREAREEMNELMPGSVRAKIPTTTAGKQLQWVLDALNNLDVSDAPERCSEAFLDFISIEELESTFREIKEEVYEGKEIVAIRAVAGDRDDSVDAIITGVGMPNALSLLLMTDDQTGKIAVLRFAPAGGNNAGGGGGGGKWDPLANDAQQLGGLVSYGVYEIQPRDPKQPDGPLELLPVTGQEEHRALNIATTMRLYVLNAIVEQVQAGKVTWDTRLVIADNLKSLPGNGEGRMQLEAPGRGYPLRRFAELMMTADDNTATDHIITMLSREVVEESVNARNDNAALNVPFLTTREAYALKLAGDETPARWIEATDDEQRTMLTTGAGAFASKPDVAKLANWARSPRVSDIGWFASAEQLCELMKHMRELEVQQDSMLISPWIRSTTGIALDPQVWKSAAYVGASEPGAMSGVWLLERQDGKLYTFSAIWNDPDAETDQPGFNALADRAVEILAEDFKLEDEDAETVSPIRPREPAAQPPKEAPSPPEDNR